MADEKDETHIDNLLSLFGAKDENAPPPAPVGSGTTAAMQGGFHEVPPSHAAEAAIAGAGAAAGALARYKGVDASNLFKPGEGVFAPSSKAVENANARLRQITGDLTANIYDLSPAQIEKFIQESSSKMPATGEVPLTRIPHGGEGTASYAMKFGATPNEAANVPSMSSMQQSNIPAQTQAWNKINQIAPGHAQFQESPLILGPEGQQAKAAQLTQEQAAARQAAENALRQKLGSIGDTTQQAKRAGLMSGIGKIAAGTLGGGLTALQAYEMAKNALQDKMPTWEEYASLAGGPAMTFGGKYLGPLGAAAQLPYLIKKFQEENPNGVNPGQYLPPSMSGRKP